MKRRSIVPSFIIISSCLIIAIVLILQQGSGSQSGEKVYRSKGLPTRPSLIEKRELTEKITIGAIGDILIHSPVYQDAFNGAVYNFDPMFENVKTMLEKPDLLTANQESTLGGPELGLSGYPTFNSPHQVADALVHNGIDIVSTANNHTLDKGEKGIQSETTYFDAIGLPHVGSYLNEQDRQTIRVIEKNGIKTAFLSYTYGTNGIPVPFGKDYLVNIIDREAMKAEIGRAKQEADVVVMSIHWGNEYQRLPTNDQKELATFLANEGVDIIFGSHPHVLQPMEWIQTSDGRKAFVIYSLGNFISGQQGDYKDIGGLISLDITKHVTEQGKTIVLSNPILSPTFVTSENEHQYRVVPFDQAGSFGLPNANVKYKEILDHMNQWMK